MKTTYGTASEKAVSAMRTFCNETAVYSRPDDGGPGLSLCPASSPGEAGRGASSRAMGAHAKHLHCSSSLL